MAMPISVGKTQLMILGFQSTAEKVTFVKAMIF